MKKTGIELIAAERQEQLTLYPCFIEKHEYGVKVDAAINRLQQLPDAAITLLEEYPHELTAPPMGWNSTTWAKMISKPYKERLIIAGALIAAEIDRLQHEE